MRIAIVHPFFIDNGGGERVIDALADLYPKADFFAMMTSKEHLSETMRGRNIQSTFLDRIPGVRRYYQQVMPLYPFAAQSLDVSGYDVIISSGGPGSKGIVAAQDALHLHYCHSPVRFLWDQYPEWRKRMNAPMRAFFAVTAAYVREWDFNSAQRVDAFIANSNYIAQRIQTYYRRPSTTIYPPVDVNRGYLDANRDDYYLSVGRLVPLKRIELLIEACNALKRRLVIVGKGPEEQKLKAIAGPTIEMVGRVDESTLTSLYARARAFLFAADDDFGIAPVEAQSFGIPVVAFGKGGSLETVVNGESGEPPTGTFFYQQSWESLRDAILQFEATESTYDPLQIRKHAETFSTARFTQKMSDFVEQAYANHLANRLDRPRERPTAAFPA